MFRYYTLFLSNLLLQAFNYIIQILVKSFKIGFFIKLTFILATFFFSDIVKIFGTFACKHIEIVHATSKVIMITSHCKIVLKFNNTPHQEQILQIYISE